MGLIIEMSVTGIRAAFVLSLWEEATGPARKELLLNGIYFVKHLNQQELASCLGVLFCFTCSFQGQPQTQHMGFSLVPTGRGKG